MAAPRTVEHDENPYDTSLTGSVEESDRLICGSDAPTSDLEDNGQKSNGSSFTRRFADFSNVFKAFIGSSLIGLPFAISKAGIVLGAIGMVVIAVLTDHCCHLIVKCKRYAINKICDDLKQKGANEFSVMKRSDYLGVRMSYGQIGKASMGKAGSLLVNIAILITQYGFCVGYFIFFGNTLRSVIFTLMHGHGSSMANSTSNASLITTPVPVTTAIINMSTPIATTVLPTPNQTFYGPFNDVNFNVSGSGKGIILPVPFSGLTALQRVGNNTNGTIFSHTITAIKRILKQPLSHDNLQKNNQWTFSLLLAMPLPLLIGISFVRQIRKLAPISVVANASITAAFAATAIYIIAEFQSPHSSLVYFNFATFPVFFGQVTAAYEGIGTVIPIEGSMAENRTKYPCYLHVSLFLLTAILGSFGMLGYARYGSDVQQIVTENLAGSSISNVLRLLLFIGVLFTYPLQIYPVIQITESALFGRRGIFRSRGGLYLLAGESVGNVNEALAVAEVRISPWKRYITRTLLVISTAVIAVAFRSQFAYIAALTGSIGSSLLSFILPCVFHLSLKKGQLSKAVIAKDYLLICFGIVGGCTGVGVTIQQIIKSFDRHQPVQM